MTTGSLAAPAKSSGAGRGGVFHVVRGQEVLEKNKRIESKTHRDAAEGQPCIRCRSLGTTVGAHYNGLFQHRVGRGKGVKCHDFLIADLCRSCHDHFDSFKDGNTYERAAEFLILCAETMARRHTQGTWKFSDE